MNLLFSLLTAFLLGTASPASPAPAACPSAEGHPVTTTPAMEEHRAEPPLPSGSGRPEGIRGEAGAAVVPAPTFRIRLTDEAAREIGELGLEVPVTGRVYVILTREEGEPRTQVGVTGVPFWGMEVRDLAGGDEVSLVPGAEGVIGHPLADMASVPAGEYRVQAFLNVFTTFRRADGHTLEMHLNSGAGQSPWRAPGNAYGSVETVRLDPASNAPVELTVDQVIPPLEPVPAGGSLQQGNPTDRGELVRFVKIRSEAVSRFWGRDMYIGANILLPAEYHENPDRRYPVVYVQGHFPGRRAPFGYTEGEEGGRRASASFSEFWRSDDAPGMILVSFRDANPYYDTSYSVNSANVGPYGDALTEELIPHLEEEFRMVPEGWGRLLAGGSTGGWEALAMQVFYPDFFGGTWGWCPDPVDFHYYQIVDIYDEDNAYQRGSEWATIERPNRRLPDGNVVSTIRQEMSYERAVGPDGRSGGQWAIWEATFSPVGPNGYAAPIWDRVTGAIDHDVADYWRQNYDLNHYLQTNWSRVGKSLAGKIHVAVGDMDSYYLDNAVYLLEDGLGTLANPRPDATILYGRRQPHCWIGPSPSRIGEEMSDTEFVSQAAFYLKARGQRW